MKLLTIFKDIDGITIKGTKNLDIVGLANNSKKVAPNYLFIARKGQKYSEDHFIPEAIQNGAVAILCSTYNPLLHVTQIIHSDVASIEGDIAVRFFRYPSKKLLCIGVTGTCGKTTTTYLIRHLLNQLSKKCALMGTIESIIGENHFPSALTTPDVISCQEFLFNAQREKCQAIVMEVSSHSLDQQRIKYIDFDRAIFTNLTSDHLDYHKDIPTYAAAKKKLFASLQEEGIALINLDSPWSQEMIAAVQKGSILTYSLEQKGDLCITNAKFLAAHSEFEIKFKNEKASFISPLVGRFNAYNLLAALATALSLKFKLKDLVPLVQNFPKVAGRLEKVDGKKNVFIDFAHTEDALYNVLKTLQEVKNGKRIITVFGCGGDRDKEKRPKMGKVASELSDEVIVTSDNPRSEVPENIASDIIAGIAQKNYSLEIDRKKAIEKGLQKLQEGDILLIAGRGHEKFQIFADRKIPLEDKAVVEELLNKC